MRRAGRSRPRLTCTAIVGIAAISALMTNAALAASDDDDEYKKDGFTDGITTSIQENLQGAAKRLGLNKPPPPPPAESSPGCPTIALLPGTEAQRTLQPGASGKLGVRYQYSLFNVGRECTVSGNRVMIKVGADGRVLLGPAGTAGRYDVPIRVAVFSEAQRKAVESRLFKVPVQLAGGQASAPFNFVSDTIAVSIPQGHSGEYSIKVGIDAGKGGGEVAAKPKRAHKQKTAAAQSTGE